MSTLGGRFTLGNEIGSGGMSRIFSGTDEVLERAVAVKVLKPGFEESEVGSRFRREGQTAAKLSHPNVVQVYDAGEDELHGRKISYIVMEHVSGGDLKRLIDERGSLTEKELSRVGADLAAGLAHAHDRGVIHRDIKPQNVLLDEYGNPKLTDFGIARALDAGDHTRAGMYLGTAAYSSPEQLRGEPVTPRSDVYSLGATLYHAAAGEPPFTGSTIEVASQHTSRSPASLDEHGVSVSAGLEAVILDCLRKIPGDRPDAGDLRERLLQRGAATVSAGRARSGDGAIEAVARRAWRVISGGKSRSSGGKARTFRPGRSARGVLLAVVAALVVLLSVLGAAAILGPDAGRQTGKSAAAPVEERESRQENAVEPAPPGGEARSAPAPDLTAEEAAATVANMYLSVVREDYASSYDLLSRDYRRREFPSLRAWERNFVDLRAIAFTGTPRAEVSGNTATVRGGVQSLQNDNGVRRGNGTWTLVAEDGGWRVDGMRLRMQAAPTGL